MGTPHISSLTWLSNYHVKKIIFKYFFKSILGLLLLFLNSEIKINFFFQKFENSAIMG